ncbi:MAG: dipeptidase [Planctomycetes bacterium]|nr:dipeptidase [Planctomycetota bacterium]
MPDHAAAFVHDHRDRMLDELKEFLRIPSISTLPENRADVRRAASWLVKKMRAAGLEHAEVIATEGHPLVYADFLHATGRPTVLCYGHYDVQPVDPIDRWTSPPFEPTVRRGNLYARGACDDKGQMYTHVKAVEGFLRHGPGRLPCNVKFLIEGEEESGGHAIAAFVPKNRKRLRADCVLVSDTGMFAPGLPTLDVGLRGILYTEIRVRGAAGDLHSGMYGGAAPNPLQAVAEIITACKDRGGKVLIPGFYGKVRRPSKTEISSWKRLPFSEKKFLKEEVGAAALTGEKGFSALERMWARPTFEVHGIRGGFTGEGAKTVIPAEAVAKVSMRLVPDQDPAAIMRLFAGHVAKVAPRGVKVTVRQAHGAPATLIDPDNRFIGAAVAALRDIFGKEPVFVRSGGSIPVVGLFTSALNLPCVLMGWGLPDDNLHAPDEKLAVENYFKGIEGTMRFFDRVGALGG